MRNLINTEKKKNLAAGIILAAAIVMIVLGIQNGEPSTVLAKAINICMQCIGIG